MVENGGIVNNKGWMNNQLNFYIRVSNTISFNSLALTEVGEWLSDWVPLILLWNTSITPISDFDTKKIRSIALTSRSSNMTFG